MNTHARAAWQETALTFEVVGDTCVAVLCQPETRPAHACGLLLLVGGPQYRAGAHRHYVQLAREVANAGHAVLRFDVRGMGDSTGQAAGFEAQDADIQAALQALQQRCPAVQRVVLFGLCDGASAAALYAARQNDPRLHALLLLNPWVRDEQTLAQTQLKHRYLARLGQADTWRRLFTGRLGWAALRGWWLAWRGARRPANPPGIAADYRRTMQAGVARVPTWALLSALDSTAQEFALAAGQQTGWRSLVKRGQLQCLPLPEADHTLGSAPARQQAAAHVLHLLQQAEGPAPARAAA